MASRTQNLNADFATLGDHASGLHRRFAARRITDIEASRARIKRIGRLSDSLIKWGPFGIGLDGVLAWIPGLGELYSLLAGIYLFAEGVRVRAPVRALTEVASLVLVRTASNVPPILGSIAVDLFRGHRWSAKILMRAIDQTIYLEGPHDTAHPSYAAAKAQIADRNSGKKRIVFLG